MRTPKTKPTRPSEFNTAKELSLARRIARARAVQRFKPHVPLLVPAEYVPATILIKNICQTMPASEAERRSAQREDTNRA